MWFSFRSDPDPPFREDQIGPDWSDEASSEELSGCGMSLFLASLTMLFGAALIGAILVRSDQADYAPTLDLRRAGGLLVATGLLWMADRALTRPSADQHESLRRAALYGTLFLGAQAWNWWTLAQDGLGLDSGTLESVLFHMLTGLHALHLVGGLVALLWVSRANSSEAPNSARADRGFMLCRRYWRYLGVVWLVLLIPLLLF